jgi:hypothetical protein
MATTATTNPQEFTIRTNTTSADKHLTNIYNQKRLV